MRYPAPDLQFPCGISLSLVASPSSPPSLAYPFLLPLPSQPIPRPLTLLHLPPRPIPFPYPPSDYLPPPLPLPPLLLEIGVSPGQTIPRGRHLLLGRVPGHRKSSKSRQKSSMAAAPALSLAARRTTSASRGRHESCTPSPSLFYLSFFPWHSFPSHDLTRGCGGWRIRRAAPTHTFFPLRQATHSRDSQKSFALPRSERWDC